MSSRKEEKERLRQQRLAAERREARAGRQRLLIGYVVAGVLTAAVVVGLVVVILSGGGDDSEDVAASAENAHIDPTSGITVSPDEREGTEAPPVEQARLEQAAQRANCNLQLNLEDEGSNHLSPSADPPNYRTNPPTSGNHDANPLADGAYSEPPEPRNYVHSLEHGRVEIHYSPDLPEEDQLSLKGVFDEDPNGILVFPNPDLRDEVAATAWTQLLTCKRYEGAATLDAIRAFRDTFRGQGPEPVPL